MNNKRSWVSRFFSHDVTLLVLAFILAFTAWFAINMSSESETSKQIYDIPVTVELPETAADEGLSLFGADGLTASVEVEGNRVTVGSLTASDIQVVTNQSSSMISVGSYTLPLTAKKTGMKSNYDFVSGSLSPSNVTVYVDREKEAVFNIENQLTVQLADSNHYANTSLSQSKVIVSGPETYVNQISSVAVIDTIEGDASDTLTVQENLVFLDEDDKILDLKYILTDIETVEATISVLPIREVSLGVNVSNEPSDFPSITISPATVKIAGPKTVLDGIKDDTVLIGTLDFTKLKNENNSQKFDISLPTGCKVISGETSATVSIDLNSYYSTTVTAKISAKIDSTSYTADFTTNNAEITVCGPEELIGEISASDVSVIADFTDMLDDLQDGRSISLSIPLTVTLSSSYDECWVYGSYTANVNVSKK